MKKTVQTKIAAACGALLLYVGAAWCATFPVYVKDANKDHGAESLAKAYEYIASKDCVPDNGVVTVRVCANLTEAENVAADFSAKAGLTKLIVEGGYWIGDASWTRQDQQMAVTGEGLLVSATLPSGAGLEVRYLNLGGGLSFDASGSVSVHDCRITGGWKVPSPAADSYVFEDNAFNGNNGAYTGWAVSFYPNGVQAKTLSLAFRRNRINGCNGISTSKDGGSTVNLTIEDNVLVHPNTAEYPADVWSLCACGGTAAGTIVISNNKMLGDFPVAETGATAPSLLTVGAKGSLTSTISDNHISCCVAEAVVKGTTANAGSSYGATGTEFAHAYPASSPDHATHCHVCADCRQALVRASALHGTVVSGVGTVEVSNYIGTGTNIEHRTVAYAVKLDPSESATVGFQSLGGDFTDLQLNGTSVREFVTSSDGTWYYTVQNSATDPFEVCARVVAMFKTPVVYSSNIHALVKVVSAATNTIVNVPWMGYTSDGAPTLNLFADHLVRPVNLTTGDFLLVHTNDFTEAYAAWQLVETSETNSKGETTNYRKWEPIATVTRFEKDNNGTDRSDVYLPKEGEAEILKEARGKGVWLLRQNPLDGDGNPVPFFLYGQWAKGSATVTIPGGTEAAPFCALLANPDYTQDTVINDLDWTSNGGPGAKDSLILTTDGKTTRYCTFVKSKGKWRHAMQRTDNHGIVTTSYDDDLTVPKGTGFWYVRRTEGEVKLTFTPASDGTGASDDATSGK